MGKKKDPCSSSGAGGDPEHEAIQKESARLRDLAVSRGLLGRSRANPDQPLQPSKALLKCDGKDIVKKGNRKSKYLFSFPGLVAPVAGGKFGDLARLDTRNPILYVDFPEGRLKLFGTILYPKNKYLTLQISKGTKSVLCEDFFEALVVFSEAWWIGKKEDNPEELKLEMPETFQQEKHATYDFTSGAGCIPSSGAIPEPQKATIGIHAQSSSTLTQTTLTGFQFPSAPEKSSPKEPTRHSARTSGRKRSYAEASSDISDGENREDKNDDLTTNNIGRQSMDSLSKDLLGTKNVVDGTVIVEEGKSGKRSKTKTMLDFTVASAAQASNKTSNEQSTVTIHSMCTQKKQSRIDFLLKSEGTTRSSSSLDQDELQKCSEQMKTHASQGKGKKKSTKPIANARQKVAVELSEDEEITSPDDTDEDWAA